MKSRLAVMALITLTTIGLAQTAPQAKPSFAGTWNLNLQKSDLGQMAPNSETSTIAQTADQIKVTTASDSQFGKLTYSFAAKLDGTDTPATATDFPSDAPFQILNSKAEWKDNALVITQTTSFQDAKGTLVSTYTLSDDGKTLTKATHVVFDQATFDSKSVYDKA
jgi:asparagine synthetase A